MDATLKDLATKNPDRIKVIFLETIGNGPRVPVLDLKRFLKLEILQELNCLIILDNTLPTNSVLPLASYLKTTSLKVIGLESATKFYLLNQDLGGFFFTYDNELLQNLLKKRKRIGATPGPSLIKTFSALLPKSKEQFDKENKLIMRNTRLLAEACEETNNAGKLFTVGHPNLKNYSGYDYAQKNYPDGSIPVFFITTAGNSFGAEELFYRLEEKGAFEDMIFTESFGFKKTAVSYCTRYGGYIRVAGGMESPRQIKKLANCLQSALSNLETSPNAHYHPGFFSTSLFK
jgi:cystathionine beta-lyase/cystathionine gamma-synthase